ncbi:hypothetical protein BDY17DRAFT_29880 [Neohortaea acidophila]|uniref:LsmAD domain-containing protein n=1 Tax=Neohortaea acidophila TaxID=245834 RepID=A0A6A6PJZ9_9PEZI|nr:uncharacterized protein BDY17DRAFT_29880 [Neohortaea acidophila]KAF2479994.1 hypothetical protein BDY17DRAFT_29880 [Neohortaea acidophila]
MPISYVADMSAAAVNGSDADKSTTTPTENGAKQSQQAPGKSSSSNNNNGKALDAARNHAASPVDGQKDKQASAPLPRAWQGTNPITQRASTHTPNGTEKPLPKLPTNARTPGKSAANPHAEKHAHDRALFILSSFIGHDATLTLKDGAQFTGIFSGGSFESNSTHQYLLKMVKQTRAPTHQQANGNTELSQEYGGVGEDHAMSFDADDMASLAVSNVVLAAAAAPMQNGSASSSFRTDTEISGRDPTMPRGARELQRWEPDLDSNVDLSLGDSSATGWDQFAVNERMYGVESTYDESFYTTAIDTTNPLYKIREAEAARIAREIEGSAPVNDHVAEERQRDADGADGLDEEEKYSGVKRDSATLPKRSLNAYVPPSKRPITSAPTVPGAPFDPAIIASSLAKPSPPPPSTSEEVLESFTTTEPSTTSGEQTPAATESVASPPPSTAESSKKAGEKSAEDHVRNAADAFKQFANDQKLRARMTAEARRSTARAERNVRLNDLKKFAENFKIRSRVPDDLVPILAKDPHKQIEIQHRAEEAAKQEEVKVKEREAQKVAAATSPVPSASSQAAPPSPAPAEARSSFSQQQSSRARVMQNLRGVNVQQVPSKNVAPPSAATGANRAYPRSTQAPSDLRIPTGPATAPGENPLSPTAATKLNVKAFEFRPAANTFAPAGPSPSPGRTAQSSMDRSQVSERNIKAPASFFAKDKKAIAAAERKDIGDRQRPVKRALEADYTNEQRKANAANGGLPKPYQTPPTWPYSEANVNASYKDSLVKNQGMSTGPSPMHTPNPNAHMPHQHQLPPHLQGTPMSTPSRQGYMPPPPQGPQMYDPRMQQFGPNGSVQSSPRFPHAQVSFNGQMPGMSMPPYGGQQMQGYGMSPNMSYRQLNPPPQQQMMMMQPNMQHNQMAPMPGQYPPRGPGGGPPFNTQMMQGGMPMIQQGSTPSPYMHAPQPGGQPYSPMPPQQQQQNMPGHIQHPGYAGSPRGHMMQHSGSHQGFQPGGMMPPQQQQQQPYSAGPGQGYPYHMQQRQMSSGGGAGGYPHMTPRQQYSAPMQPSPGMPGGQQGQGQGDGSG